MIDANEAGVQGAFEGKTEAHIPVNVALFLIF